MSRKLIFLHTPLLQLLLLFYVPVVMLQKQNKSRKKHLGGVDYVRISLCPLSFYSKSLLFGFVSHHLSFFFLCMFDFVLVLKLLVFRSFARPNGIISISPTLLNFLRHQSINASCNVCVIATWNIFGCFKLESFFY